MLILLYLNSLKIVQILAKIFIFLMIITEKVISQVDLCQANCEAVGTYRLIGPRAPNTRPHPWKSAQFPSKSKVFCKLGCQYFYNDLPNNNTCKAACSTEYRYKVTVDYSDLAEEARLECEDGCDIGLLLGQPGYYSINGTSMIPCPLGTFREGLPVTNITNFNLTIPFSNVNTAIFQSTLLQSVTSCVDCPYGTYRTGIKGTSALSCTKCPIGKYANQTGSIAETDCLRCPAGTFTAEEGARVCLCITPGSCDLPELISQGEKMEDFYLDGVDYFRETIPYTGRN